MLFLFIFEIQIQNTVLNETEIKKRIAEEFTE